MKDTVIYIWDSQKIYEETLGLVLVYCLTLADTPGRIALLELSPRLYKSSNYKVRLNLGLSKKGS